MTTEPKVTMWISKYALSKGRIPAVVGTVSDRYFRVGLQGFYVIGLDANSTREAALEAAEAMRIKKIASLKKQIAKLEKMKFVAEDTR